MLDHTDNTKTTYICPRCDMVYHQVDRALWEHKQHECDGKARVKLYTEHECWWQRKKRLAQEAKA